MDTITLQTKQDLDIFVNPRRQSILRCMRITGGPMTPKQIADRIGISASSVQHHLKRLLSIGVVEPDHTETIHGIIARFYRPVPKTISIGLAQESHREQRIAVLQSTLTQIFSGYANYCTDDLPSIKPDEQFGDLLDGIVHLEPEHAKELYAQITDFLQSHEHKTERSTAWEYALIAYPIAEKSHD